MDDESGESTEFDRCRKQTHTERERERERERDRDKADGEKQGVESRQNAKHIDTNCILNTATTRHRASTSVCSLTFRVRVMLPQQRNPGADCKSAQQCTTRGHPLPLPQVAYGSVQQCGHAAADGRTERHIDARDHNTFRVVYDSREV